MSTRPPSSNHVYTKFGNGMPIKARDSVSYYICQMLFIYTHCIKTLWQYAKVPPSIWSTLTLHPAYTFNYFHRLH